MYNTKVRLKQGGEELDFAPGAKQTANGTQADAIANHANPATATTTEIATKQNAILAALRGVGIIKE